MRLLRGSGCWVAWRRGHPRTKEKGYKRKKMKRINGAAVGGWVRAPKKGRQDRELRGGGERVREMEVQ